MVLPFKQFLTNDVYIIGGLDAELHLVSMNVVNGDRGVVTDMKGFTDTAGKDKHEIHSFV